MPGGEWTIDTLREHIIALLVEMDLRNQQRFEAAEKASSIALDESQRWHDAANEWRGAMNDRERMLMPRSEAEQRLSALAEKVDDLKGSSRAGAAALWGYLVGAIGVVAAVVALVLR